jgi:hypothetical protein
MKHRCTPSSRFASLPAALAALVALAACTPSPGNGGRAAAPVEAKETELQFFGLAGPIASPDAEISGLVWFGDLLVLLPQYPEHFAGPDSSGVFVLPREDLIATLDGERTGPLEPRLRTFPSPGLPLSVPGYDGLEALAIAGDRVYFTIEAVEETFSRAYLVAGRLVGAVDSLRLDLDKIVPIPADVKLPNMSFESLVVIGDRLVAIHEANGVNVNPNPGAYVFDLQLDFRGFVPSPNVEYRLTDATDADADGRFWVINYFFPGEEKVLRPALDPEIARFGLGASHARCPQVERLLEFRFTGERLERTDRAPVTFHLREDHICRNWEGVVRLDGRGFLLVTDRYPTTLLAFAPGPA